MTSLKTYLTIIEEHYHTKPIIYSNINFIETWLADDFSDYSFWIAHYYADKLRPAPGIKWLFWQYHDQAKVSGCNECIDVNVFKGSSKDFNEILIRE